MSYGVALLMTGSAPTAGDIVLDIFRQLQPTLDRVLSVTVAQRYAGRWTSGNESELSITVAEGSLWITKLHLKGTDVLRLIQNIPDNDKSSRAMPITMWSTGRLHEFR
jgi:hypothetical protein